MHYLNKEEKTQKVLNIQILKRFKFDYNRLQTIVINIYISRFTIVYKLKRFLC
jgi:hypothetical protein